MAGVPVMGVNPNNPRESQQISEFWNMPSQGKPLEAQLRQQLIQNCNQNGIKVEDLVLLHPSNPSWKERVVNLCKDCGIQWDVKQQMVVYHIERRMRVTPRSAAANQMAIIARASVQGGVGNEELGRRLLGAANESEGGGDGGRSRRTPISNGTAFTRVAGGERQDNRVGDWQPS